MICHYCRSNREANVHHDKIGRCCSSCAKRHDTAVQRKGVPCIICATPIVSSFDEYEVISEVNADSTSCSNGVIGRISAGFGSDLDGNVYIIGICRDCAVKATKEDKLIYCGDYINGTVPPTKEDEEFIRQMLIEKLPEDSDESGLNNPGSFC